MYESMVSLNNRFNIIVTLIARLAQSDIKRSSERLAAYLQDIARIACIIAKDLLMTHTRRGSHFTENTMNQLPALIVRPSEIISIRILFLVF